MAKDIYKVFEGTAAIKDIAVQSGGNDYIIPSDRMFIVRAIAFFNGNVAAQTGSIKVGNTYIGSCLAQPSSTNIIDCENTIVLPGEKIYVKGQVDNDIKYRMWGVEMDM